MSDIVVYSCVTANYDNLDRTLFRSNPVAEDNVQFILFTDDVPAGSRGIWNIMPLRWHHHICQRRTARYHKCMAHQVLPAHDYSVWVDGSQAIKSVKVWEDLVEPLVTAGNDVATFKHPIRQCVYQEEKACEKYKKDNTAVMRGQMNRYRGAGYPAYNGMVETACVIRANTPDVHLFNTTWWDELEQDSFRDQLSFNYVCWSLDRPYGHIPGHRESSPFFEFVSHKR